MRLELGEIHISDIKLGDCSKVENGTLYVNVEELRALLLEDEDLALSRLRGGSSRRVRCVSSCQDVIEPRVKVEGSGGVFPHDLQGHHRGRRQDPCSQGALRRGHHT